MRRKSVRIVCTVSVAVLDSVGRLSGRCDKIGISAQWLTAIIPALWIPGQLFSMDHIARPYLKTTNEEKKKTK